MGERERWKFVRAEGGAGYRFYIWECVEDGPFPRMFLRSVSDFWRRPA